MISLNEYDIRKYKKKQHGKFLEKHGNFASHFVLSSHRSENVQLFSSISAHCYENFIEKNSNPPLHSKNIPPNSSSYFHLT